MAGQGWYVAHRPAKVGTDSLTAVKVARIPPSLRADTTKVKAKASSQSRPSAMPPCPRRRPLSFWNVPGTSGENSPQSPEFHLNLEPGEEKPRAKAPQAPVSSSPRVLGGPLSASPTRGGKNIYQSGDPVKQEPPTEQTPTGDRPLALPSLTYTQKLLNLVTSGAREQEATAVGAGARPRCQALTASLWEKTGGRCGPHTQSTNLTLDQWSHARTT